MRNRPIVAGILILTTCASVTAAAEPGPFVAEWHWNKAESTSAAGEAMPREMVLNITSADPAHVVWTLTAVDDKGVRRVQSFTGAGDGKPVPIAGSTDGSTTAFTVTAAKLDSVSASPDGSTDRSSCSLSVDRKKMTCRGTESDGKGHSATYVDVYDRK
jgi:hypothetical protein